MKKTLFAVASIALLTSLPVHAQFGGMMGGGAKTTAPASGGDVDAFLKTAEDADGLIRKSSKVLFEAVATKDQMDANADKVKAANEISDPKEKEAALKKASDDQQAVLAKTDFAAKSEEMKKGLDAEKSKKIGTAIYNFTLGMLKDKEVVERGQGVIASISGNPTMIGKLGKAKDVMSSVSGQMGSITTIASGIQKLSTVVKLEKLPTKASDAPTPMSGD